VTVAQKRQKGWKRVKRCGIYMMLCVPTNDFYIGCSFAMDDRWYGHVCQLKRKTHERRIRRLARRYGLKNFRFMPLEIIERKLDRTELFHRERQWINELDPSLNSKRVYWL
jgi:group I intron endonuclease